MLQLRSFRGRIFMALLAVALIPAVMLLWTGTLALREVVSSAGTAGPWEAVAESGRVLLERVADEGEPSPEVRDAALEHREALSEGVRHSQIYAFVGERLLGLLPAIAVGLAVLIAGLALFAARHLSRQFARPINDLVGWTRRIARSESLPDPGGSEASGIAEVRALQEALRSMDAELREGRRREIESARLRSWTEMARRVSHELKNPLTPMRMAAVTVARSEEDAAVAEAGTVLLEEIDRLDEMAHAFAHFGRLPEGPTSEIDLGELLEELARRHAVAHIPVNVDVAADLPRVRGHYDAVLRVFRNLLVNAMDAVEGAARGEDLARGGSGSRASPSPNEGGAPGAAAVPGGEGASPAAPAGAQGPATTAGFAEPAGPGVRISVHGREGGVEVSIRDSGPGIPPELLERIWTPDFTTKRRGSGLGLALVRRTVESYGGSVSASNEPGGGARFTVHLPAGEGSTRTEEVG